MGTASGPSTWAVTLRSHNSCLSLRETSPGHINACALFEGSFRGEYSSTALPDDTVWPAFPPDCVGFSGPVVTPPPLRLYGLAARVTSEWQLRYVTALPLAAPLGGRYQDESLRAGADSEAYAIHVPAPMITR